MIMIDSRKSRELGYVERRLERFYLPLQNALIAYPSDKIIEKAASLSKKLSEVENYTYLASPELKKLIPQFRNAVYSYDKSINHETAPDKMHDLLEKIEMTINKDIKKSLERIEKLTN